MKNKLILILVMVSFFGFGQKIKYIETKTKHFGSYISQIQFIDTITDEIIKTVDVKKDNPFYKILPKPDSIFYDIDNAMYFKYNNISLEKIISKENRIHYKCDINNSFVLSIQFPRIYVESKNKELCFMYGNAFITTNMDCNYSLMFVAIYNKNGSEIFNKIFYYGGEAVLSSNNNFLNIAFSMDSENGNLFNSFFEIYDISNNSLIYKSISTQTGNYGVINNNDTVFFFGSNNIIFDNNKMELYNYERVNGKIIKKGLIKKIEIK